MVAASARGVEERSGATGFDHVAAAAALQEGLAGWVVGVGQEGAAALPRADAIVVTTSWKSMSHLNSLTAYRVTILCGNNLSLTWFRHF